MEVLDANKTWETATKAQSEWGEGEPMGETLPEFYDFVLQGFQAQMWSREKCRLDHFLFQEEEYSKRVYNTQLVF